MEKQKILKYILIGLTLLLSFFSWYLIHQALNNVGSHSWILPAISFSFLFIFISLDIVLIKETYLLELVFFSSYLLTFFFFFDIRHLAFILLSLIFAFVAIWQIKREMKLNLKLSLMRIIGAGKYFLVFSLALMISSQYYFEIKNFSLEKIIPRFETSRSSSFIASKILSLINPNFANLDTDNLTIDEFISQIQQKQMDELTDQESGKLDEIIDQQAGTSLTPEQKTSIRQEAIQQINKNRKLVENSSQSVQEGRKALSEMVGFELKGNEKASEVFTQIINKKIADRIQDTFSNQKNFPVFPIILAVLLFLAIISLGSILNYIYIPIAIFFFFIFKKMGLIAVSKIPTEKEVIE
jgi:hypothetical protein